MKKVGFVSLGCPKNLVDSEVMMGQLKEAGYEITNDAAKRKRWLSIPAGLSNRRKPNLSKRFSKRRTRRQTGRRNG